MKSDQVWDKRLLARSFIARHYKSKSLHDASLLPEIIHCQASFGCLYNPTLHYGTWAMACHISHIPSQLDWSTSWIYHSAIHLKSWWLLSEETMVSVKETINLDIYIETWFPVEQVANTFQQEITLSFFTLFFSFLFSFLYYIFFFLIFLFFPFPFRGSWEVSRKV